MVRRVETVMGTVVSLDLPGDSHAGAADDVFAWLHAVDARFSTYRPDSEVSRFGRGELRPDELSPDLAHVLDACEDLRTFTHGYFDAYAAGTFDPSGYVKGWSVQVASHRLVAAGARDHCINAGGDVIARGTGDDGKPWRIGIRHPFHADQVAWVLAGTDLAVATSGTYERGGHVIDPYRGVPATGLRSVTVTGPDLALADAYATAALAMGERAHAFLAGLDGYECVIVSTDGEAWRSDGLPVAPD